MIDLNNLVITIARGFGSGGRTIGKMLAKSLNIEYYDQEIIKLASIESGISENLFSLADENKKTSFLKPVNIYKGEIIPPDSSDFVSDDNLFNYQAKVIKQLASTHSCVVVGRCADFVLKQSNVNLIRVFIYAPLDFCVEKVCEIYSLNQIDAKKLIEKIDKRRMDYYKYYTATSWNNAYNYDLCLNSSVLGFEKTVEVIQDYIKIKG